MGNFSNGISIGQVETLTNKSSYKGSWDDGPNGYGVSKNLVTNETWEGQHVNQFLEGQGKFISNDYEYIGEFKKGAFHNQGKIILSDGTEYLVNHDNGKYIGDLKNKPLNILIQKRIALVIGNNDYESRPLSVAVNDSLAIKSSLENLGFEVIYRANVSQKEFLNAIFEYGKRLAAMGSNTTSLFYYSGHAVQVNGINYLNPIDTTIQNKNDLEIMSLKIQNMSNTIGR